MTKKQQDHYRNQTKALAKQPLHIQHARMTSKANEILMQAIMETSDAIWSKVDGQEMSPAQREKIEYEWQAMLTFLRDKAHTALSANKERK